MEKRYEAFMLRLWQVGDGDKLGWRASLERPSTGELCGFATLDELISYLRAITELESREQGSATALAAGELRGNLAPRAPGE